MQTQENIKYCIISNNNSNNSNSNSNNSCGGVQQPLRLQQLPLQLLQLLL